jgi:regulator of extracellular matrix RemA (YlzA/DUF370 family)
MVTDLAPVGYGNFLVRKRVQAVFSLAAAPVQRLIRQAKDEGISLDLTNGRRTRSVAILDTGRVALLGLRPRELAKRGLPVDPDSLKPRT